MSTSRSRGTRWETTVADHFHRAGFTHVERRALRGRRDTGDLTGIPGLVIECKATRNIDLATTMDEVRAEVNNTGDPSTTGVAIIKRRRAPVGRAYVVLELDRFIDWLTQ